MKMNFESACRVRNVQDLEQFDELWWDYDCTMDEDILYPALAEIAADPELQRSDLGGRLVGKFINERGPGIWVYIRIFNLLRWMTSVDADLHERLCDMLLRTGLPTDLVISILVASSTQKRHLREKPDFYDVLLRVMPKYAKFVVEGSRPTRMVKICKILDYLIEAATSSECKSSLADLIIQGLRIILPVSDDISCASPGIMYSSTSLLMIALDSSCDVTSAVFAEIARHYAHVFQPYLKICNVEYQQKLRDRIEQAQACV
jgi:hypothetical protein